MNNIILVDDRQDFIEGFTTDCAARGYNLFAKRSLEGLKSLMPNISHKVACVILDIKCLHTDSQQIEDTAFIGSALTYLDQNFPKFPRMILTGDDKEYDAIRKYYRDEDIYLKTTADQERLFSKIKFYVDNSDELRIKRLNLESFEAFKTGILPENKATKLYELFKISETGLFKKEDFNSIRDIFEDVLIWARTKNLFPLQCMKQDGRPNLEWSMRYLTGLNVDLPTGQSLQPTQPIFPKHIGKSAESVKQVSSIFSHSYNEKVTLNAFRGALYNLAELLVWCKDYSKTNFGI